MSTDVESKEYPVLLNEYLEQHLENLSQDPSYIYCVADPSMITAVDSTDVINKFITCRCRRCNRTEGVDVVDAKPLTQTDQVDIDRTVSLVNTFTSQIDFTQGQIVALKSKLDYLIQFRDSLEVTLNDLQTTNV